MGVKTKAEIESDVKKLARRSWWVGAITGLALGLALGFAVGYEQGSTSVVVIPLQQGVEV